MVSFIQSHCRGPLISNKCKSVFAFNKYMEGVDFIEIHVPLTLKAGCTKLGGLNFGRHKMREMCVSKSKPTALLNKPDTIL